MQIEGKCLILLKEILLHRSLVTVKPKQVWQKSGDYCKPHYI
jgi:hypothetical protein